MPSSLHFITFGGLCALALLLLLLALAVVGPLFFVAAAIVPCLDLSCLGEAN